MFARVLYEFLAGPGKKRGVKVYYLKPLCVEVGDDLIFTSREDIDAAIAKIQREVFSEYRRLYLVHRPRHLLQEAADIALRIPRKVVKHVVERKKRAIDAYQRVWNSIAEKQPCVPPKFTEGFARMVALLMTCSRSPIRSSVMM